MVTTTSGLILLGCLMCQTGGLLGTGTGTLVQESQTRTPENVIQPKGDRLEVTSHPGVGQEIVQEVLRSFFDELKRRPDLLNGILKGAPISQLDASHAEVLSESTKPKRERPHHLRRRDTLKANVLPVSRNSEQQTILSNGIKDHEQLSQTDQHKMPSPDNGPANEPVLINETHPNLVQTNGAQLTVEPKEVALKAQSQYLIHNGVELSPSDYYYVYFADGGENDPGVKFKPDEYYYYVEGRDTESPLPVQNGVIPLQNGGTLPSVKEGHATKDILDVRGGDLKELKHKNPNEELSSVSNILNEEKELGQLHS